MRSLAESQYENLLLELRAGVYSVDELVAVNNDVCVKTGDRLLRKVWNVNAQRVIELLTLDVHCEGC